MKRAWRFIAVLFIVLSPLLLASPVAAIANPGSIVFNTLSGGLTNGYKIFQNAQYSGDWLLIACFDVSYGALPSEEPETAFALQLLDASNNLLFARPIYDYNYAVGSIYLTSAQVAALTWGASYKVRVVGNPALFGTPVEGTNMVTATMGAADWVTGSLSTTPALVNAYCLAIADGMETHDTATYIINTPIGQALNTAGRLKFVPDQIPNLYSITPSLFQSSISQLPYTPPASTGAYSTEVETHTGAQLTAAFAGIGTYFGMSGQMVGGLIILMIALVMGSLFYAASGSGAFVFVGIVPVLILGTWLGVIPMAVLFTAAIVTAAYMAYHFYLRAI